MASQSLKTKVIMQTTQGETTTGRYEATLTNQAT